MRLPITCLTASVLLLWGCSGTTARQTKVYAAGEKAASDNLIYTVIDSDNLVRLGDEGSPRIPKDRFLSVQISVSNSGNADAPIPTLTLAADDGKTYPELADGTGLAHWLGVVRKVGPGQTERGYVLFDAPAAHYKLKLTDEADPADVYIDMPLSFVHEQMNDAGAAVENPPGTISSPKPKDEKTK